MREPLALLIAIASPFLLLLAIHVWRDARGASRNERGLCYACGCRLTGPIPGMPIHHKRGDTYLYCAACARRHDRWLQLAAALMAAALLAAASVLVWSRYA